MNCNCTLGLTNSGVPNCEPIWNVAKKLIIVPMFQDDGTANEIDLTNDTLNATYFNALRDQAAADQRWYPLPIIENATNEKGDPITQSFDSGRSVKIQDGPRTFNALIIGKKGQTPNLLAAVEGYGCERVGAYIVDKSNNLIGIQGSATDKIAPIEIDGSTWDVRWMAPTDTTISHVSIGFQWEQNQEDSKLRMIASSSMANFDLLGLNGLLDVYGRDLALPTSTTQLAVKLFNNSGTKTANGDWSSLIEGLGTSDLTVYNVTTDTDVTPSAIAESPAGSYTLTFSAQTSADVLKVKVEKTGFSAEYAKDIDGADITFTVP